MTTVDRHSRRAVLAGACGLGCALAVSGCATYGSGAPKAAPAPAAAPAVPAAVGGAAPGLAKVGDIPVGGGVVFADQQIVVIQPVAGTFKAFDATCTHQGCQVTEVSGGTINCPCHGSRFAVADGSVAGGPAPRPLAARAVTVDNGVLRTV